ncbi:DNA primase [uncultured Gammaproteobacteria bacterium]
MAFPPGFLDELRARLPLSEVAGRRIRVVRTGREFKACCPFHNEKTPSFTLSDQKGFFHCFGCGAHGDIIGFVMRHDNLSFPEAVEVLAGLAGMQVPRASPEERKRFEREKTLYDLVEHAARWFESRLYVADGGAALGYLSKRGLDDAAVARFRLGYAPADGGGLIRHLAKAGFPETDMIEAGLARKPDDGRAAYSFFRDRVMFPVADRRGRVVAFGGRLIAGDGPKYINTAETPLFHKGRLLYGLSRARQTVADGAIAIVAEGYMDVITLVLAGFGGAVAPLGTALTEEQIVELWRLYPGRVKCPVLCFDGDGAGRRAAERAVERVLPHLAPDQSVKVAFMPEGEDPDTLIRGGGVAAMQSVLDRALPLAEVVWRLEVTGRDFDTPEARAGLKAALDERMSRIADRTVQGFYRDEMRKRLDEKFGRTAQVSGHSSGRAAAEGGARPFVAQRGYGPQRRPGFNNRGGGKFGSPPPPQGPLPSCRPRSAVAVGQRILLITMLNHPELFDEFHDHLGTIVDAESHLAQIRLALLETLGAKPDLGPEALLAALNLHGLAEAVAKLLDRSTMPHAGFARIEAPTEEARFGLHDLFRQAGRTRLTVELDGARRQLSSRLDQESLNRVTGLRREIKSGTGDIEDDSGDS